jgi:NADPH:quinone reductase-like Zn-dependent oxidoreductase
VTVAVVGADVQRFQAGDKVCALLLGGGYATKLIKSYSNATEQPKSFGVTPPERDS